MGFTMRVSLPGYDALTDTNPDHYALYADNDWVLIKEKARGVGTVGTAVGTTVGSAVIAHNLGYIPMALVYGERFGGGTYSLLSLPMGQFGDNGHYALLGTANLTIFNDWDVAMPYKYFIFYDQQL